MCGDVERFTVGRQFTSVHADGQASNEIQQTAVANIISQVGTNPALQVKKKKLKKTEAYQRDTSDYIYEPALAGK